MKGRGLSQIKQTIVMGIQIFFLNAQLTCAQGFDRGFSAYMLGDYETAIIEWRNKASLGSVTAMANLGNTYEVGAGVEQSYILAHQWYNLAASNGDVTARENKKIIEKSLSADEVSTAITQAKKCMSSGYVDCL